MMTLRGSSLSVYRQPIVFVAVIAVVAACLFPSPANSANGTWNPTGFSGDGSGLNGATP